MRKDMKHLLTDTYRSWGWGAKTYHMTRAEDRAGDVETLPTKQSMRRRYMVDGDFKVFGDRLAPLYRFLKKSVGKQWDDVYAQIAKHTDTRNILGHHLREHVDFYVDTTGERDPFFSKQFVVDSQGILRKAERRLYPHKQPRALPIKQFAKDEYFIRYERKWYHVRTRGYSEFDPPKEDALFGGVSINNNSYSNWYNRRCMEMTLPKGKFCVAATPLTKQQAKELGLV